MRGHSTARRRPDEDQYRPRHARDEFEGIEGMEHADGDKTEREAPAAKDN